jgi:replication factor C subunit 3/5
MFFIDKYAPKTANKSILHKDILKLLEFISKDDSIPHIIFYGNDGVGKRRIIKLFLEMLYGKEVNNIEENMYIVSGSGNKVKEVFVKQSDFHIMIEPVDNNFDKYLIQDVVKEYAKRIQINIFKSKKIFKSVLINNLDNLSYYAQTSLRRTMEKYSGTCRFIMWCKSLSRVIEPLKSRCICIRISAPSNDELFKLDKNLRKKQDVKAIKNIDCLTW